MTPWYAQSNLLLLFAFAIAMTGQVFYFSRLSKESAYAARAIALTVIAFLGVFAALVVSDEKSAAAIFGLLGAIAGFLVGKTDK